MTRQQRELHHRLEDAEKLRLYAQSTASTHKALEDGLGKARSKAKYWERKAKECIERATRVKNERDEAKEEAQVAHLVVVAVGDAKARVESDLAKVQESLVAAEEARRKAEAEIDRLEVERTSLLLELMEANDKVSSLHSQAGKDKEAM